MQDVIARQAEQGADDAAVAWADAPQTVDARAPHQVEQEGLHAVVGMMGHGYGVGSQLLTESFEPLVAQLARGHFDGDVPVGGVLRGVEVDNVQGDVPLLAQAADELLVAVSLLSTQVEVAMRRFACITQLRQQEQEGHGVGAAAQGHDDFAACFQQTFLGNVLGNFLLFHTCKGSINREKYKRRKQRFRAFLFPRCRCFISRSAFLRKALLCNL